MTFAPRRNGLSREFVASHRRRRVVQAVAELADEEGVGRITVGRICGSARIGRNTFYETFPTIEDGLSYAFEAAFATLFEPVRKAATEAPPSARIAAAVGCLYATATAEHLLASLSLVHCFEACDTAREHDFEAAVDVVAGLLAASPSIEAELRASTIVAHGASRLRDGRHFLLPGEVGPILELTQLARSGEFGCADVQITTT